jgi:hypothetical protein
MPINTIDDFYKVLKEAVVDNSKTEIATSRVATLLGAMKAFTKEEQATILKQLDKDDCNLLMLAALHNPSLVPQILTAMEGLEQGDQAGILKQLKARGHNALMLVVRTKHAEAVNAILAAMQRLKQEDQATILKQSSQEEYNAIMYAAYSFPEAVVPILEAMKALVKEDQAKILMRATTGDSSNPRLNALVLAGEYHRDAVIPILLATLKLGEEEQADIVEKHYRARGVYTYRDEEKSSLTLAARCFPEALGPILSAIVASGGNLAESLKKVAAVRYDKKSLTPILEKMKTLRPEEQAQILKQHDGVGYNLLMRAADSRDASTVEAILSTMEKLSPAEQAQILKQHDDRGYNALMLAACCNPKAIAPILTFMRKLGTGERALILKQCLKEEDWLPPDVPNLGGYNALMFAAYRHPETVAPILVAIGELEVKDQALILKHRNHDGKNALMIAKMKAKTDRSPVPLVTYEVEMRLLLVRLNEKIGEFERLSKAGPNSERYTSAAQKGRELHGKLIDTLSTYQGAERSKTTAEVLSRAWKAEINAAKKSILVEFPGVKEILRGMLILAASIIIFPYGVYRAVNRCQQNKSLFFTTGAEQILDELEQAPHDLSKKSPGS